MKVVIYSRSMNIGLWAALLAGLRRHGLDPEVRPPESVVKCDLAVVWGTRRRHARASGRKALVMERGYVGDRMYWTSLGFGGLNGNADFRVAGGVPSDRFERHFAQYVEPWRERDDGEYVLLIGQVPGNMALRGVYIQRWYGTKIQELRRRGYKVRFRPHPGSPLVRPSGLRVEVSELGTSLEDDLANCKWAVTWNSNAGVVAAIKGVPVVAEGSGSMAWPVASRNALLPAFDVDRTEWLHKISYAQWSPEEIEAGDAWDHLKSGMEDDEHVAFNHSFAGSDPAQAFVAAGAGLYQSQGQAGAGRSPGRGPVLVG